MTKEEIGKILKSAREQAGLTQKQVALQLGRRQQVIGNWETGYAQPDANTLFTLCDMYGISIDDAFGKGRRTAVTATEIAHIKKYRTLDEHGKDVIDTLLEKEYTRCQSISLTLGPAIRLISMQVFSDPAAAGIPLYAESDYERIDVPEDEVPLNAEFGIRISGNSMEPTIRDGQIAWIQRRTDISDNHIGVFMLSDGTAVCKRAATGPDGRILRLLSDNPAYDPIEGTLLDGLRIVGEVLNT